VFWKTNLELALKHGNGKVGVVVLGFNQFGPDKLGMICSSSHLVIIASVPRVVDCIFGPDVSVVRCMVRTLGEKEEFIASFFYDLITSVKLYTLHLSISTFLLPLF